MRIKSLYFAAILASSMLFMADQVAAQGFDYENIEIEVALENDQVEPGGSGLIEITITVPAGYSLSGLEDVFDIKPLSEVRSSSFGELEKPEADYEDEIGSHYLGVVTFHLPFTISKDALPGRREIKLGFQLQICDEISGQCFFPSEPEDITRTITVDIVKSG